jgi:hypothetical protein
MLAARKRRATYTSGEYQQINGDIKEASFHPAFRGIQ